MSEKIPLANQIRDKLDAGVLPRVLPEKMRTGYGHGNTCDGCDQPIHPAQIEYEFLQDSGDCSGFTSAAWACGWPSCGDAAL